MAWNATTLESDGVIETTRNELAEGIVLRTGRLHRIRVQVPLKARVPIRLSHDTLEQTRAWLLQNPIQVEVDGKPVPCGAVTTGAGRIDVQFRMPSGEHALLISSFEQRNGGSTRLPPQRIIYISQMVKVRE